jgi:hypothetical protein
MAKGSAGGGRAGGSGSQGGRGAAQGGGKGWGGKTSTHQGKDSGDGRSPAPEVPGHGKAPGR